MNKAQNIKSDAIVIGSGMGGLTTAALLAKDGLNVNVLEAAHVPGGCSSSFTRKGYTFESGATTLIGFDRHQPLQRLENLLGIELPKTQISPSMTVYVDGEKCVRYQDREQWIAEAGRVFGNFEGQAKFWELAFSVSDIVWKVSEKNTHFPPRSIGDLMKLALSNSPLDAPVLRFAFQSVQDQINKFGINTPTFRKFVDEQLMITAQATSEQVPFLFGAAGLTYTNYANYYVEGGLLEMVRAIQDSIERNGSKVLVRRKVVVINYENGLYTLETESGHTYEAPLVYSNIPIWNMKDITKGHIAEYFDKESKKYSKAWGAFTMGIVTDDTYDENMSLHHQIHLDEPMPNTGAKSIFVSMSMRGDNKRAKAGTRSMNVSCHAETDSWFAFGDAYESRKEATSAWIIDQLRAKLPGFAIGEVTLAFASTPVTWQNWVHRYKGRVGGIPQQLSRSLLDWSPAITPFEGLYMCGDTVYPGQGIPGVTLSGINVYYRSKNTRDKILNH